MRRSIMNRNLVRCVLLLAALAFSATASLAQAQGSSARIDIAEMLKSHDDAMNQHNLDGVLALFSSNPKTVVIGTGPGEKFMGQQEIRAAYTEIFKDFDKGTLTHSCYWKDGRAIGTVAWGAFMCKFSDSKGEKKREYELNVTAVVEKKGDKWQFVMVHYS